MAAKKKKPKPEEIPIEAKRQHALAICIGYNELAKIATILGERIYYRMARDNAVKDFVALGGNADLFAKSDDGIVTIELPDGPPHVILRECDVDLMRKAIAAHEVNEALFDEADASSDAAAKRVDAAMERERDELFEAAEGLFYRREDSLCRALSTGDPHDEDDPPVTCTRDKDHEGPHEGGTRCGTITWKATT